MCQYHSLVLANGLCLLYPSVSFLSVVICTLAESSLSIKTFDNQFAKHVDNLVKQTCYNQAETSNVSVNTSRYQLDDYMGTRLQQTYRITCAFVAAYAILHRFV